ncbi:MAG: DUF4013 domain-containing protein [Methanobacteriaceae archaeon]|nr:DUF4013 domain-containing protein [Methanobacteriaceae archaeon]
MKVGEIVGEALDYPGTNLKKVLILGILNIISFLIIPIFLVLGYNLRVLKATIAGFDELPDFDEWGDMLIDGLKVLVVGIVYMLIPIILVFGGVFLANTNPTAGIIVGVIGVILAIIFGLVEQIAIAHMAFNDRLGAAFQVGEILNVISEISWIKYIIWIIGVAIIQLGALNVTLLAFYIILIPAILAFGAAIAQIASEILTAGFIIVVIILLLILYLFVIPYLQIFYARALGRLYADR